MNLFDGFALWRDIGIEYEGVLLNLEAAPPFTWRIVSAPW